MSLSSAQVGPYTPVPELALSAETLTVIKEAENKARTQFSLDNNGESLGESTDQRMRFTMDGFHLRLFFTRPNGERYYARVEVYHGVANSFKIT